MHEFTLTDGMRVGIDDGADSEPETLPDYRKVKLSRPGPGEQFAYVFDFGDDWQHICAVGEQRIDPLESIGKVTQEPAAIWGWGDIPDQYQRRWDGDDGESPLPPSPQPPLSDLPPILADWRSTPRAAQKRRSHC